jgi:hypothetical protein
MPPDAVHGGRLLHQSQLQRPPKSFFDFLAQGPAKFGSSSLKTEFFNGIGQPAKSS